MQPTFLPWPGYLRLMDAVDVFVFLDDVQLAQQSWQTRNRVLIGGEVRWITVPIKHVRMNQTIEETEIAQVERWGVKTARILRQSYARHPKAAELEDLVEVLEICQYKRLADLNIALIKNCADKLAIGTPCLRSSSMALASQQRTERLLDICEQVGCDVYVSPIGSSEYLANDDFVGHNRAKLEFARYNPPPYPQRGLSTFISHLSIIDVAANIGWKGATDYIRRPWAIEEAAT